jgi:hypothetical protein
MQWITYIADNMGLHEEHPGRIVSYTLGDEAIQLSGFFTAAELHQLASYLAKQSPGQQNAPPQQYHQPDVHS